MPKRYFIRTDATIPVLTRRVALRPSSLEEFKEIIKLRTVHPKNETTLKEFAATVAQAAKAGWGRSREHA